MKWFCGFEKKSPTTENYRDDIYGSAFTYNTERNFQSTDDKPSKPINTVLDDKNDSSATKFMELFLVVFSYLFIILTLPFSLFFSLKFVNNFEQIVVMRLGKLQKICGPGTVFILPCIDKISRMDIRVSSFQCPPLQIITADKGLVEVFAVVFYKIVDPMAVLCGVQNKDQQEFNNFCLTVGLEITQISVTQMNVVKEGENQAISLFNTLVKSDFGSQLMGQIAPHLKDYVAENFASNNSNSKRMDSIKEVVLFINYYFLFQEHNLNAYPINTQDSEINILIERLRCCCNAKLVAEVNKYYRIKCVKNLIDPVPIAEFDLNLHHGSGFCEWTEKVQQESVPDVIFTLQKSTLFSLINGSISPMSAYMKGQLVISGSVSDAMGLKHLVERFKELRFDVM